MSIPLPNPNTKAAPERKPGEFRRRGLDGPPIIRSVTKTRARQGTATELKQQAEAAGIDLAAEAKARGVRVSGKLAAELLGPEPADEPYRRPSSFDIGNQHNLIKWKERQVALGIGIDPQVLRRLDGIAADDEKAVLDGIVKHAHDAAQSSLAADRGTYIHTLTEWAETDMTQAAPWCEPRFGLTDRDIDAIGVGWTRLLTDNGLEVLAVEAPCISDQYRTAGVTDRVARCTRQITFGVGDTAVTIPAGTVIILDIKTSKLWAGRDGLPDYWDSYPLQLLAYAASVRYDPDTDERVPWDDAPSQSVAVIAHLDVRRLIEAGEAVWQLIAVDLDAARAGMEAHEAVEAYTSRRDKFAVSVFESTAGTARPEPDDDGSRRARLRAVYADQMTVAEQNQFVGLGIDADDLDAVESGINQVMTLVESTPAVNVARFGGRTAAPPSTVGPDEGPDVAAEMVEHLRQAWLLADPAGREWVAAVTARAGNMSLTQRPSQRRLALGWSVTKLAVAGWADDDLLAACCVHAAVSSDLAELGHVQAAAVADVVDDLISDRLEWSVTDDGAMHLTTTTTQTGK